MFHLAKNGCLLSALEKGGFFLSFEIFFFYLLALSSHRNQQVVYKNLWRLTHTILFHSDTKNGLYFVTTHESLFVRCRLTMINDEALTDTETLMAIIS